ncbi:hypothetical protein Thena_1289 [Thermodesulfobium narugense DSM 14796]|uniref:Uncharacterized protein n=1 Tax=Thermodesulfobium narugense DSM 14796 TaxID=747365 RepID=M1E6P8_9BACT|nr:hypothetical protein [Thermodesulfobium narugense]AEE14906.1 hypothetical protein Thena_1289 [Thermodesulfobium narugense DSM 14796]
MKEIELSTKKSTLQGFVRDRIDLVMITFLLLVAAPLVYFIARSTVWAAIVPVGAAWAGLISKESPQEKLITMGGVAQGLGLVVTLYGLGQVIGPAIAAHNVEMVGYGVSIKIEATITGLLISVILSAISARLS